jgi:hypothetical protein
MAAEGDSAPMQAEVLASMPAPVRALASRVSDRVLLFHPGRSTHLRLHLVVRLRRILSEGLVASRPPAPRFNTSGATQGPLGRRSGKAESQEVPTSVRGILITRLR